MKFLSESECRNWLDANLPNCSELNEKCSTDKVTYALPIDTGAKTALAGILSRFISPQSGGLFWITCWGIFPSAENMALFDGYRKSLGEVKHVYFSPGHLFGDTDTKELECLIALSLYFFWDAILYDTEGTITFKISHDEFISVCANSSARLKQFEDSIAGLKLRRLTE